MADNNTNQETEEPELVRRLRKNERLDGDMLLEELQNYYSEYIVYRNKHLIVELECEDTYKRVRFIAFYNVLKCSMRSI